MLANNCWALALRIPFDRESWDHAQPFQAPAISGNLVMQYFPWRSPYADIDELDTKYEACLFMCLESTQLSSIQDQIRALMANFPLYGCKTCMLSLNHHGQSIEASLTKRTASRLGLNCRQKRMCTKPWSSAVIVMRCMTSLSLSSIPLILSSRCLISRARCID